jgi:DNA-binding transcriptional MerR regulator
MTGEPERMTTGEFSRRSQLSIKALRLYDRLGLLRPAAVDGRRCCLAGRGRAP